MIDEKLGDLMERAVNGELDENGLRDLEVVLDRDPDARAEYVRYMAMDADLWLGTEKAAPRPAPAPVRRSAWTRAFPLGFAAAALLFSAILVVRETVSRQEIAGKTDDRPSVAFAARTVGDVKEIVFVGGTRALLQGEADLTPDWTHRGTLHAGQATVFVPPGDLGFTLDTPLGVITSQDGEFGVAVGPAGTTHIAVFRGEIDLQRRVSESSEDSGYRVLTAGETIRLAGSGITGSASPPPFLRFAAFAETTRKIAIQENFEGASLDPARWQALLRAPHAAVAPEDGAGRLLNRGWLATAQPYDPARLGGIRLRGRWTFVGPESEHPNKRISIFTIVLRSSLGDPSDFYETGSGIKLNCYSDNGKIFLVTEGEKFQISRGRNIRHLKHSRIDMYEFEIVDDGVNITFTVREVGNPSNFTSSTATVLRDVSDDNYVLFYGRERQPPNLDYEVRLDDVVLETGVGPLIR